ncbi:hypothetical protein [Alloyangia pacifica]|uniref:Uncharacterized protein n=1 Tax=Alloyangia pacifica TaxID=311180 RepID=A0A1I6RJD6_9RHOB|nr:hypothetical protein [Alloyangia pacifica]SDG51998.1 hypothetical protein SAMN04488245_103128 [Alloyangia pacifica]SFS64756.1 hypothetical protein SAMN04488050_103128 [Alloyangia pacifica]
MLEAVARRKAHWLFNAESAKSFYGKRRPQEDMVTSAVFGSISQMSPEDRYGAIEILLGRDAFKETGFTPEDDIDLDFWPRLAGPAGRRHVEPDILLKSAGRTAVVEVKWHAPLSERQLEQQVEAAGTESITAVVMLGEAGVEDEICGVRAFRRTWRDVAAELQKASAPRRSPLWRWQATMLAFLQETDMGRVFAGLSAIADPDGASFQFRKPGHPPWLDRALQEPQSIKYTFGEAQ